MLGNALADLEIALPSLDLRGAAFRFGSTGQEGGGRGPPDPRRRRTPPRRAPRARLGARGAAVRFGSTGKEGVALAIHDPHGRTIHLPPESGAGAIAHEVGPDLDWQVAHARYGTHAAYATEDAIRNRRGDPFATA